MRASQRWQLDQMRLQQGGKGSGRGPARVTPFKLGQGGGKASPSPHQATPKIRCNEGAGAQVGTQGTCPPGFAESSTHQFLCQHRSPLIRLRKPDLVHHQSRHLHKLLLELSGPLHGALQWWSAGTASRSPLPARQVALQNSVAEVPADKRVSFRESEEGRAPRNRTPWGAG